MTEGIEAMTSRLMRLAALAALLVLELILLCAVAAVERGLSRATLDVWALVSFAFAPWWLIGVWLGGGTNVR